MAKHLTAKQKFSAAEAKKRLDEAERKALGIKPKAPAKTKAPTIKKPTLSPSAVREAARKKAAAKRLKDIKEAREKDEREIAAMKKKKAAAKAKQNKTS